MLEDQTALQPGFNQQLWLVDTEEVAERKPRLEIVPKRKRKRERKVIDGDGFANSLEDQSIKIFSNRA
jgi:hypothetical protein